MFLNKGNEKITKKSDEKEERAQGRETQRSRRKDGTDAAKMQK